MQGVHQKSLLISLSSIYLSFDCFYFFWMDFSVSAVLKRMQSLVCSFRYLIMSYISIYHIFFYILITINQIFCFRKIAPISWILYNTYLYAPYKMTLQKLAMPQDNVYFFLASFVINANLTGIDLQQRGKKTKF